jgi:hypothetical protein
MLSRQSHMCLFDWFCFWAACTCLLCVLCYVSLVFLSTCYYYISLLFFICGFSLLMPLPSFLNYSIIFCRYAYIWIKTYDRSIGPGNLNYSTYMISYFARGWSIGSKTYLLLKVCCNTCKKPVKASQYAVHAGAIQCFYIKKYLGVNAYVWPAPLFLQLIIYISGSMLWMHIYSLLWTQKPHSL